ncbi:MAG: hypothetical protein WCZ27_08965 [Tissierellaceae bacterium]
MKRSRVNPRVAILCISSIISLGSMGVGYSAWNDRVIIDMSITTGYIDADIEVLERRITLEGEEYLDFVLDTDGKTLFIEGQVYPEFNNYIDINILDGGSIPFAISKVEEIKETEIVILRNRGRGLKSKESTEEEILRQNQIRESLSLQINPSHIYKEVNYLNMNHRIGEPNYAVETKSGGVGQLELRISELRSEIESYKQIDEEQEFKYNILFEQGI